MLNNPAATPWLLLIPLLIIVVLIARVILRKRQAAIASSEMFSKLTPPSHTTWRTILSLIGFTAVLIAIMQPLFGTKPNITKTLGQNIYIAMDTSASMATKDVSPSRFDRAKTEALGLIQALRGNRIGLINFAGKAAITCPLTTDIPAIELFLHDIQIGSMSRPGTNVADAIIAAYRGFLNQGTRHTIILLTDGESFSGDIDKALKLAKDLNIRVYPIAIGTAQGDPIPTYAPNGRQIGFKRDETNQLILSKRDSAFLKRIAQATTGTYFESDTTPVFDHVYHAINKLEKEEINLTVSKQKINQYQWPLALGVVCLLGSLWLNPKLAAIALIMSLSTTWGDNIIESIKTRQALAAFKAHDFPKAEKKLSKLLETTQHKDRIYYNLGKVYQASQNPAKAYEAFTHALATNTDPLITNDIRYELALSAYQLSQHNETLAITKGLLIQNPNHRNAKKLYEIAKKEQKKQQSNPNTAPQPNPSDPANQQAAAQALNALQHQESAARKAHQKRNPQEPTQGKDW